MTRFDFEALTPGDLLQGAACVRERTVLTTREKRDPYLNVRVGNSTGESKIKIWQNQMQDWDGIDPGAPVYLEARVKDGWNGGSPELAVIAVRALPPTHPIVDELQPRANSSRDKLESQYEGLRSVIARPGPRILLDATMESVGREEYFTAPAAKRHHHATYGGLAEHSLEVARLALSIAAASPARSRVDVDLLVVGSLLHDVGKIFEFSYRGPIEVSPFGRLRSHVSVGPEVIRDVYEGLDPSERDQVDPHDLLMIQHVMESHHGKQEWGSPRSPATLEALIVHHADNASAKIRAFVDVLDEGECRGEGWSKPKSWGPPLLDARSLTEGLTGRAERDLGWELGVGERPRTSISISSSPRPPATDHLSGEVRGFIGWILSKGIARQEASPSPPEWLGEVISWVDDLMRSLPAELRRKITESLG